MIRIGNQTACWAATPREPFDYAVASGFDAFEWFPDKKPDAGWDEDDLNAVQRRAIRETARAHGIRLSVHARWQADPLEPSSWSWFEKDLELAEDLGAVLLNIHFCAERGVPAFVTAIRPLVQHLARAGKQLAIENTPAHAPEEFNALFTELRRANGDLINAVGMCFDLGHANLCAATRNDYLQFLDRLAPAVRIVHLHLHENFGDADTHLPLFTGPAGQNDLGIRGLVKRLRQRNFSGSAIMEQWPHPPSQLNEARDQLIRLLDETYKPPLMPRAASQPSPALDEFARQLVAGDQRCPSWREKLNFIRDLLTAETTPLTPESLVDMAVYLRFLGSGEIACVEDGRHFRPAHHARIALQIRERLARLATPETAFIIRKIYPWLPSSAREFQRAEPLTRIRDIAHRNDIPSELKREIKHSLQNKLHRCAGPEDLTTSTALLERITAPDTDFAPEFVEQFRIFHEELKEFFNARSLDERLEALAPAAGDRGAHLIHQFLKQKSSPALRGQIGAFQLLTELRQCLVAEAECAPGLERHEFLLADIGLEDFAFALLSEIVNGIGEAAAEASWDTLWELSRQTIENLELSQVEPEETAAIAAELRSWCPGFQPADREQLLRLKATVDRARRLAESYCDRIMTWFPPRARALGRALNVPESGIQVFGDAEIRSHLVFQLSKLVSCILRRLRASLAQPAWDVVVGGQATGRVRAAEQLEEKYAEPVLVLLNSAEGDEEIPTGVKGIVLAHDLPHLSHLGVRARQAGVVLVACEEPARFEELMHQAGSTMTLNASAESVTWQLAAAPAPTVSYPREIKLPPIRVLPEHTCIPLDHACRECAGQKADGVRRLTELAQQPEAGFKVPAALVIPFGVMEQALRQKPRLEAEYRHWLNELRQSPESASASAHHLRELVEQLTVPAEVTNRITSRFSRHSRLMVRSSANVEDLPGVSGAGLYESVANVSPAGAAPAVRAVWASLWTRRAVLSRRQAGIPSAQAHMAVLIQQMWVPDFSFILHTVNPATNNPREACAEIVVGLGETLAAGATRGNPCRLVGHKASGKITTEAFANFSTGLWPVIEGGLRRQTVDYSRVPLSWDSDARKVLGRKLVAIAEFLEQAMQSPQDIEGLVKGDEIYLVQTRPQPGKEARQ